MRGEGSGGGEAAYIFLYLDCCHLLDGFSLALSGIFNPTQHELPFLLLQGKPCRQLLRQSRRKLPLLGLLSSISIMRIEFEIKIKRTQKLTRGSRGSRVALVQRGVDGWARGGGWGGERGAEKARRVVAHVYSKLRDAHRLIETAVRQHSPSQRHQSETSYCISSCSYTGMFCRFALCAHHETYPISENIGGRLVW